MKSILVAMIVVLVGYTARAEGWNSIVATTVDVSSYTKSDNFSNKDGIHILLSGASTVKYVLLNSSGTVVRQSTLENSGAAFPNVTGDDGTIYALYQIGSAIKVKRSTNAGANWSSLDDITFSDSYCSGVDALADDRGLHVVYATRPSSTGPWETYYTRFWAGDWEGDKNVTDYESEEVGGFPTVAVSSVRVHVSYNTGEASEPSSNSGDAKTRDYNFDTEEWEDPQLVYGYPTGYSMSERIYSDGTYLHMFYYKLVEGMGQYHSDTYHTKRTVSGSSWSSSTLIESFSDVTCKLGIASSANGTLHIAYPHAGLQYRNYDGTNWTSEVRVSQYSSSIYTFAISSVSNDLYVDYRDDESSYLQYRQYDALPLAPEDLQISSYNQYPKIVWSLNTEPDVCSGGHYVISRRTGPSPWTAWAVLETVGSSTSQYVDYALYGAPTGENTVRYKIRAKDTADNTSAYSDSVSTEYDYVVEKSRASALSRETPPSFVLHANSPNPFNPSTTINFELPENADILLTLYDVLGREVATLVQGYREAGYHAVVWDAKSAASGVYYARFTAADESGKVKYSKVNKLLLMK